VIDELEYCPLLCNLQAQSNAIIQFPTFQNSVLLTELNLSSNSISSSIERNDIWLPFLKNFYLSNNNLNDLPSSTNCVPQLRYFDVAFNQISDVELLKTFLQNSQLSKINLKQNPVLYDQINIDQYQMDHDLTYLLRINNNTTKMDSIVDNVEQLYICQNCFQSLLSSEQTVNRLKLIEIYLRFLSDMNVFLIDIRQSIEKLSFNMLDNFSSRLNLFVNQIKDELQQFKQICHEQQVSNESKSLKKSPETVSNLEKITHEEVIVKSKEVFQEPSVLFVKPIIDKERLVIQIQSLWRGYHVRDKIKNNLAAIRIQSTWKGYSLRKRLSLARQMLSCNNENYTEVDLKEFDFDEAAFDAKLRPRTPSASLSKNTIHHATTSSKPPLPPLQQVRHAWRSTTSPVGSSKLVDESIKQNNNRDYYNDEMNLQSSRSSASSFAATLELGGTNNKQKTLQDEWGIQNRDTTALMLKRAEKMKYGVERKQKLQKMGMLME
ncbi:unnamed protein product, partial [Didymodactylos carnosus]